MGGSTDVKVKIKKCTNLEGSSMLPGWSSDPWRPRLDDSTPRNAANAADVLMPL